MYLLSSAQCYSTMAPHVGNWQKAGSDKKILPVLFFVDRPSVKAVLDLQDPRIIRVYFSLV